MTLERIHLDPLGGLAGDMFAAAMAHAFPEKVAGLMEELGKLGPAPRFVPHADSSLAGLRFVVQEDHARTAPHDHAHGDHAHLHVPHARIREQLRAAGLQPKVLEHALALFQLLAGAEARVHGVRVEDVEFHEVGAWDSIADFVAAAYFIAVLEPAEWTCGPLPLGGGRVRTAHGVLPVPAPATTLLLEGMDVIDDGIPGERVTPTGAAIARYVTGKWGRTPFSVRQATDVPDRKRGPSPFSPFSLSASGHGFGTRTLPGMPNVLRVLAFAAAAAGSGPHDEEIAALAFEIDDQTAEDLAIAVERIRQAPGVLDVAQLAVYGKKSRLATQVQVLARLDAADAVAELCLDETTTLGVRIARVRRRTALRAMVDTNVPEPVRVKVAERPSGELTAKAESDDLARLPGGREKRQEARRRAERQALESMQPYDPRRPRED